MTHDDSSSRNSTGREMNASRLTSRRDMLRTLAAGTAAVALSPLIACARKIDENGVFAESATATAEANGALVDRIGLQLYTVRRAMSTDLEGTIAAIAAAGVNEVEFAGYYDKPASWWNDLLRRHGISAPATHIALPATDAEWAPHFARAKEMGHRWVIVPWIGNDYRSADGWKRLADRLNSGGAMAQKEGLRIGYHNHDFEFAAVGNTNGFESLVANTDAALVDIELDIYWAVKAGQDPLDLLARHGKRITCCHIKDAGPPPDRAMLDVGAGTIDFNTILERGRAQALRHWFIEHDNPRDPLASVRASAATMKTYR